MHHSPPTPSSFSHNRVRSGRGIRRSRWRVGLGPGSGGLIRCYLTAGEETKKRNRAKQGPGHINYARDVARCKCNTNWTGPLIIIHWRHLLAYLTVHRSASLSLSLSLFHSLFAPRSTFSTRFSLLLEPCLLLSPLSLLRRSIELVVDYHLLNASAKTARDSFKSRS